LRRSSRGNADAGVNFVSRGIGGVATLELASDANLTPRDKLLLAHAPYAPARIPEPYRRHIVDYHRAEAPAAILVDTDARYLYYVLPTGKAIRYGVAVGEEALASSGVARVGRKAEWPEWIPTPEIQARLGDTLYRIYGTNQPEYIGQAISSGCIRVTDENVIDLYNRVNTGATVVVLAPGQGDHAVRV
jgi:lipoprotein-anchoring transpeptidase ErfK/SrfK